MKKLKYKIEASSERGGRRCSYDENNPLDNCHDKDGWRAVFAVLGKVLHEA